MGEKGSGDFFSFGEGCSVIAESHLGERGVERLTISGVILYTITLFER